MSLSLHMDVSPPAASQCCNSAYMYPPVTSAQCFDRLPSLLTYGFISRRLLSCFLRDMGYIVEGVNNLMTLLPAVYIFRAWMFQTQHSPLNGFGHTLFTQKSCFYLNVLHNYVCVLLLCFAFNAQTRNYAREQQGFQHSWLSSQPHAEGKWREVS